MLNHRQLKRRNYYRVGILAAGVWLGGCAPVVQRNDWASYSGPGAAHFQAVEYQLPLSDDPLEPVNRVFTGLNDVVLFDVVAGMSAAWRLITPQAVRDSLVNAANNLGYPGRAVNHLLQGEFERAGSETRRFAINSTLGVAGLFDAASKQGIDPAPTSSGQTLTRWGWQDSTFVVLPLLGPSTTRDVFGQVADSALDPTSYFFPAGPIKAFVIGSERIPTLKRFSRTSYDPYELTRMMSQTRTAGVSADAAVDDPSNAARETLQAARFTFQDPWFPARSRTRRVPLPDSDRVAVGEVFMQSKPAPMVFILPGLGVHRRAQQALALAEVVYNHGFSVVTLSSPLNFDFMNHTASTSIPGYAPVDAVDCHRAVQALLSDLRKRHGERITGTALMGMSLGAYHTLLIAAGAQKGERLDRYVALYPAVRMEHGAECLDAFYNVPLSFPPATRQERVDQILQAAARTVSGGRAPPVAEEDAEFLIGLSYRVALHDIIWCSQERHDMGVLKTPRHPLRRTPASREIYDYSFIEYFYAFVLPYYLDDGDHPFDSAAQMFERMDLRHVADGLRDNDRIHVLINRNDFLIEEPDIEWLQGVLGPQRVLLEPSGGHMGNIAAPKIQQRIIGTISDLR